MVTDVLSVVSRIPRGKVASGRTAPGWGGQRLMLKAEGVTFKENGYVDMAKHAWTGRD